MSLASNDVLKFLSVVKIFKGLDQKIIGEIAQRVQTVEFSIDDYIVRNGETGERLYLIFDGKVEVQIPNVHGEIRKRVVLQRGEIVGEISLLVESTYTADIVALASTTALYLDSTNFNQLIKRFTSFSEVMSSLMANRMAQNGGINQVGRYQLLGKLGEGNMAIVFMAYDPVLNREVALKMLKYQLASDGRFMDRFEQEAKIIAALNHPNIVNVIEIIDQFSTRFIVMEKLEGQNISQRLKERGPYGIHEARRILSQIASALEYAHQHGEQGIVHRDVKPSNIVIDQYGNIKLTDFGIAGPPSSKDLKFEGTPSYMAPEIISGKGIDGRVDIYSLGVMAYQMLTNILPFTASTLEELFKAHAGQPPPDIRFACLDVDENLASFIDSALSKTPEQRISDWQKIRQMLEPVNVSNAIDIDDGGMGILIKLQGASFQESAGLVKSLQKVLKDSEISHSIELIHGDKKG